MRGDESHQISASGLTSHSFSTTLFDVIGTPPYGIRVSFAGRSQQENSNLETHGSDPGLQDGVIRT
jgi:hypothetical protein